MNYAHLRRPMMLGLAVLGLATAAVIASISVAGCGAKFFPKCGEPGVSCPPCPEHGSYPDPCVDHRRDAGDEAGR